MSCWDRHYKRAGTTASGMRAGVPTVIVPHQGDQGFWGRTVQMLGVGTAPILRKKLTADKLAAAIIKTTIDREMKAAAIALGEKIANEDGLDTAVKVIDRFLRLQ